MTTPAARNLAATPESLGTVAPYKANEPARTQISRTHLPSTGSHGPVLVILSMVAMLFLIKIGIPCSGLIPGYHKIQRLGY